MSKKSVLSIILISVIALFSLWPASAQDTQTLTVFAASSLTDAFNEMATAFKATNPNVDIAFNFGGSSTLAAQLAEGAPADVFASANNKQMQVTIEAGRIVDPAVTFARNRLVVVIPADNPAHIKTLHDLATPGVQLILAAPGVPVRDYTDTMLEKLAADADYGDDYRQAVLANLVSEEDNVRQVVAKIALGEADAGVVYLSDVTPDIANTVITLDIPDEVNTIASYPIAITKDSALPELAQAFVDFVLSEDGQAILTHWNFISKCPEIQMEVTPEATLEAEMTKTPYDASAEAGCP